MHGHASSMQSYSRFLHHLNTLLRMSFFKSLYSRSQEFSDLLQFLVLPLCVFVFVCVGVCGLFVCVRVCACVCVHAFIFITSSVLRLISSCLPACLSVFLLASIWPPYLHPCWCSRNSRWSLGEVSWWTSISPVSSPTCGMR